MPCTDGGYPYPPSDQERYGVATLCGVFAVLEGDGSLESVLARVDWQEVGAPRAWVDRWWKRHKADDEKRRAQEAREAEERRQRDEVLRRLSPEERRLLGIRETGGA